MIKVEGRELRDPMLSELCMGSFLVLRVDDLSRPDFWLTVTLTPEDLGRLFDKLAKHLIASGQWPALSLLHGTGV